LCGVEIDERHIQRKRPPTEAALLRTRFDAVAPVATEDFDQWLGPNSGQLAHRPHFGVALLALTDFPDLLGHLAMVSAKPVGTMKI
jgi:hypothetical protein